MSNLEIRMALQGSVVGVRRGRHRGREWMKYQLGRQGDDPRNESPSSPSTASASPPVESYKNIAPTPSLFLLRRHPSHPLTTVIQYRTPAGQ